MSDDPPKIFDIPIPKNRRTWTVDRGSWRYRRLLVISKLKPEEQAAEIICDEYGPKVEIRMLHGLAHTYGFKVTCRPTNGNRVLIWVKKPGFSKDILKMWNRDI